MTDAAQLLTVREAAHELGVNEQRIRLLCAQGRIMGASKTGERLLGDPGAGPSHRSRLAADRSCEGLGVDGEDGCR